MTYSSEVLADSPIVYYRLGEASGTTAADASGGGNPGTYLNSPTLGATGALTGDADTAVTFVAASSQTMQTAFWSAINVSTFTLECWVKTTGANQAIMGRQGTTNAPYSMFISAAGKLQLVVKPSGTWTDSGAAINDGAWHHVAVTRDNTSGDVKFYIDGALSSTSTGTSAPNTAGSAGFAVSGRGGTPRLDGSVDEAALYGTALTLTRIAAHYTAGTTGGGGAAAGSASLSLSASGGTSVVAAGAGSLSLSAAGGAAAVVAGAAAVSLAASGGSAVGDGGSASLIFSAAGDLSSVGAAAGSAVLSLSASGGSVAEATGAAALLTLGAGGAAAGASGGAFLSLSAAMVEHAAGDATLELSAGGSASALYVTDTTNSNNGRTRDGSGTVTIETPVAAVPPGTTFGERYDKALALPEPVMVDGRPT